MGRRVSNLNPLKIRKTHEHTEGFRMAIDSVKRSVLEINARSSRSPGPLFDISVMHVVTAVVIRDRVWIIRRQRATPGIRNGSRVPRDLQNRPCSPKLSLSLARAHASLCLCSTPVFKHFEIELQKWRPWGSRTNKGTRLANSRNWYPVLDDLLNEVKWRGGSVARNASWWCVQQPQRLDGGKLCETLCQDLKTWRQVQWEFRELVRNYCSELNVVSTLRTFLSAAIVTLITWKLTVVLFPLIKDAKSNCTYVNLQTSASLVFPAKSLRILWSFRENLFDTPDIRNK